VREWSCGRPSLDDVPPQFISGPMDDPQFMLRDVTLTAPAAPDMLIRPVLLDPERVREAAKRWLRVLPDRRG